MAVTPANNEAFFREVDEELRRDRAARFWRQWGLWVLVAIVVGLAAFGGWLYWQHRRTVAAGVEGEQLQSAYQSLAAGNTAAAGAPLSTLAQSRNAGYRALATFTQADILLEKKDTKGAIAKFASVAGDAAVAQPFRDLALIRQTVAEFDALKPQVVVDRLRPLAVPGGAWLGSAGELVAAAYLKMGRRADAGQMFARIAADSNVPETLRQRAVQMASAMNARASGTAAAPANQGTTR
ncbi:tetratricopeptide repeat protein [Sphingomonas sp.]|uniref:tetratricopeptide repeat protein n=1 Tax=Sphingomonas sp. TaxID=28214 RepID=UPI0035BBE9E2